MSSYKNATCTGTVSSVEDAISALHELGDECREIVDNATDGLRETQRIQTLEETASTLESVEDSVDVPQCVADLGINYSEQVHRHKRRSPSRAVRCSNAVSQLSAAVDVLECWLGESENEEHDDHDDVTQLRDTLQEIVDNAEGCDFPGMYG